VPTYPRPQTAMRAFLFLILAIRLVTIRWRYFIC
jgi:hypothetical protein